MKRIVFGTIFSISLVITLGFGFVQKSEQKVCAGSTACGREFGSVIDTLSKNWTIECAKENNGKFDMAVCLLAEKFQKILPRARALANNGPFKLGPRDLMVGTSQNGTLVNPGVRTFLTPTPMDKNSLTVEIQKKGGQGGAAVYICKINEDKKYIALKKITFEAGSGAETKKETVSAVKGHIVQVYIDGTGGAGKAFDYTLKTAAN